MKKVLLWAIMMPVLGIAQLNLSFVGQLDLVSIHNSDGNDIWGYVDGSGNEYAIMGLNDGTSIVDVTNPAAPLEVFHEPGMNSVWRDIKTWGDYAYVTTEAANGLLIIDMSSLPNAAGITTTYYTGPVGNEWQSAHNLYIDEQGQCYIFGANRGNGGCIILDVDANPTNPVELGEVDTWYTHDGVCRGDTLYQGHISDGFMSIHDVSDPANPVLLGTHNTPGNFTHNLWYSGDGDYIFTTDEISNGFLGAYDISNPANITYLDKIQSNPGSGSIPHNTHTISNFIVTSYYRDGVTIHDITNPNNLIEVGNYDTSPLSGDGFNGAWGVYPWLPSGNLIVSDIESGLFILAPTYVQGCYLEGLITDANTTFPISNASIDIVSTTVSDNSNLTGNYATGIATAGTYDVTYSKVGYFPQTITGLSLTNGNTVTQDVQLVPLPTYVLDGNVTDMFTGNPVDGITVIAAGPDSTFEVTTNSNGDYLINGIFDGTYELLFGTWGYVTACTTITIAGASMTVDQVLREGYYDDFSMDYGWTVSGNAPRGIWERGEPDGTTFMGDDSNPDEDVQGDCIDQAYVTGNGGGNAGSDDVDDENTILTSPVFDLTNFATPTITFYRWWFNDGGGGGNPDDTLIFRLTDGTNTVVLSNVMSNDGNQSQWHPESFLVSDYLTPSANMQLIIETADWDFNDGHLVEAGIDVFEITHQTSVPCCDPLLPLGLYPNPFSDRIMLNVHSLNKSDTYTAELMDITGRVVFSVTQPSSQGEILVPEQLPRGTYVIRISHGKLIDTHKMIKE